MSYERDNIAKMTGYASGEQPDDADTIKLNTNENPWPPSPAVEEALRGLPATALRRYPPPLADGFRDIAAARHRVSRESIIATRGGDELLRLVITTFVDPGQTIAMTDPTYSLYPVLAQIQDCNVVRVPLEEDWSIPEDLAARIAGAKLTLIVNPHAPSGRLLTVTALRQLATSLDGLLLIDEAYVDFVDPDLAYDSMVLVRELDNVIILRSLSKGYSLAGLRFGYGIGAESLIAPMLHKTRDSYNLDYLSQKLAEAALSDRAHAGGTWEKVRRERSRLAAELHSMGFTVHPSQSNFLLAGVPDGTDAGALYRELKQRGILVRYFDQPRLADKLRISVGTPAEDDRLIDALMALLAT